MFKKIMLAGALGAFSAAGYAASFSVSVLADDSSRWYDYFSNAYAEIGEGFNGNPALDGSFLIGPDPGIPGSKAGDQIGSGFDYFPNEGIFTDVFTVHYDEVTGAITGLTDLKFNEYILSNISIAGAHTYAISVANISGTVQRTGGVVSGLDLSTDITFTYDLKGAFGFNLVPFTGSLNVGQDGSFALLIDQMQGPMRQAWDITGTVTSPAPVPLPASALLLGPALAMLGFTRRRQARG